MSHTIPKPIQPSETAAVLDCLPGMIGAIDQAFVDETGHKIPFILVAFTAGQAVHCTNINPPADAIAALRSLMINWDAEEGGTVDAPH